MAWVSGNTAVWWDMAKSSLPSKMNAANGPPIVFQFFEAGKAESNFPRPTEYYDLGGVVFLVFDEFSPFWS